MQPKIYHIVHIDRLISIIEEGCLWCDAEVLQRDLNGTSIGMNHIKLRRLNELKLTSFPDLYVGDCVPFYFCPRSVMLYIIYKRNYADLAYCGGQESIVHLEADLQLATEWAEKNNQRWVFTLSNAGALYFEDRSNLSQLVELEWDAIQAKDWRENRTKEGKQAEFLIEYCFPWTLVERIGIHSANVYEQVANAFIRDHHQPAIEIKNEWYY